MHRRYKFYELEGSQLAEFKKFEDDESVLKRLEEIKLIKKKQFAEFAKKKQVRLIKPTSVCDTVCNVCEFFRGKIVKIFEYRSLDNVAMKRGNAIDIVTAVNG